MTIGVERDSTNEHLDVMQGISHALGSTSTHEEVTHALASSARAAVGDEYCSTRLFVPVRNRLRIVASQGEVNGHARLASQLRSAAITSLTVQQAHVRKPPGLKLVVFPLVCREEPHGVLEVIGDLERVDARWKALEAIATQGAVALLNLKERTELERQLRTREQSIDLALKLVQLDGVLPAVKAAMDFCHVHLERPVAAWFAREHSTELRFVGARGVSPSQRRRLRDEVQLLAESKSPASDILRSCAAIFKARHLDAIDVDRAVILVAGDTPGGGQLTAIEAVLREAVRRQIMIADAKFRSGLLDTGIEWTAHELRRPLVAVMANLERIATRLDGSESDQKLVLRTRAELQHLSELLQDVLRWPANESLTRVSVNLTDIVEQALDLCGDEAKDRVSVGAPRSVKLLADPEQLRIAISNILRNAMEYSRENSPIVVSIRPHSERVTLSIRNSGPMIPAKERGSIFDPRVRGASSGTSEGTGLGLSIARRLVEAQGGAIWLESNGSGTVFHLEFASE